MKGDIQSWGEGGGEDRRQFHIFFLGKFLIVYNNLLRPWPTSHSVTELLTEILTE